MNVYHKRLERCGPAGPPERLTRAAYNPRTPETCRYPRELS